MDVALERDELRIACEIAISTSVEHELGNVMKCLAGGFDQVVVVSSRKRFLGQLAKRVSAEVEQDEAAKVETLLPEEALTFLETLVPESEEETFGGYKVNVSYKRPDGVEHRARQRAVEDMIRKSLKRMKGRMP